jgi:cytochrome P450 family 135
VTFARWTTQTKVDGTSELPMPPSLPVPAALQTLIFPVRHRVVPWLRKRYGDVFAISMLGRPAVFLCNPELNRIVFGGPTTTYHAGEGNVILRQIMGKHSVLTTDEEEHQRIRKLLMPSFHGAPLRGYRDMMAQLAAAEVNGWTVDTPFVAHRRMNAVTLEIILRVVFGVAEGPRLDELRSALSKLVSAPTVVYLGEVVPSVRRYGPWKRFRDLHARIDQLLYAEIADRRAQSDATGSDVLSQLVSAQVDGDQLSDAELRDQMITLLLAGHETTATTLAWTLHDLARDTALQDKVIAAVDTGDDKYLEAVVKESMRLHPVIYGVARMLTEDVELGGYRIPAGYTVLPGIGPVHADPAHHTDPQQFRPERFLDGSATTATWLPFGGGARRCLGAGFALLEAGTILREVLLRYRISPARPRPEKTRARNITLAPSGGARIVVHRRAATG